jgi:hypothetical protein
MKTLGSNFSWLCRATLHSRTRKPGVCETNGVLKNVLYYFKSRKQLKQLSHSRPHLHKRGRTNLEGEGETKAVVGIKAALVDSTIPLHITARCLKSTRTGNQGRQTKTSVKCAIRKATTKETVPCLSKSDLTVLRKKIMVKPRRQRKQAT